jgi:peroxiredoxin
MGSARQQRTLEAGARAPEFDLPTLDSKASQNLAGALASGPVLLAFFKVTCPTCQLTMPFIERMYKGAKKGVARMFAVSQDDAADTREFHREYGITMPTLLDGEKQGYPASNAYGLSNVPSLFLIEPNTSISWSLIGFNKKQLEALGAKLGVNPFRPGENVPEMKGG